MHSSLTFQESLTSVHSADLFSLHKIKFSNDSDVTRPLHKNDKKLDLVTETLHLVAYLMKNTHVEKILVPSLIQSYILYGFL